ncbi:glycosyltransferase family 2 protein [Micromonospora sp. NPDC050397]|uniref:glycosyltransferase family 2 protein n=1 Tax=Micromonospora sp. NPDC050397 TaxID=3364279 RepID=UPI00384DD52C
MRMLGIVIVNYLSAADTAGLVRSLAAHHTDPGVAVTIAVVDNSDQRTELEAVVELARQHGISGRVLHGHGNVGYAAGNNLGAACLLEAGAEVVWVLNPDTRITGGKVGAALDVGQPDDRAIGATTSVGADGVGHPDLGALDLWTGQSGQPVTGGTGGSRTLTYVAGHSVLVTRRAWLDLGGFSEDFFLFYEEADLAVRAAGLGIPTVVIPDLVVRHAGGGATGATSDLRAKSTITYLHASRSCMIFFRKHHPLRLPLALTARLGYAGKALLVGGPRAASAILRGMVAGLRA